MVETCFEVFRQYMFPSFASNIVQAVDDLSAELSPPYSRGIYFIEIRRKFLTQAWVHRVFFDEMIEPLFALACRHDCFYIDANMSTFSTRRLDDTFRTYSENLAHKWPGYVLAASGHIFNSTDRLVHMDELLHLMRSKDVDRYEREMELYFGPQARYTTGNACEQMKVVYATYPRSGNSLMRKYFENVTGTATGSDMVIKHQSNMALQFCGFKAEGITDQRTWINKTHFPFTLPFQHDWDSDIAVVCTRYQLDADPSFFYLMNTQCHSGQFRQKLLDEQILPYWVPFQQNCTRGYQMWFNYWITQAETTEKPVYFFRFEDILANPEEELRELFKFILGIDNIDGTVIERRIKDVMRMGAKKNQTYKPRQGGTNRNLNNYLPEQIQLTKEYNEELFHIFGYVKDEERLPNNVTPFLDFEGKAKPKSVEKINYYKQLNKLAMERRMRIGHRSQSQDNKISVGPGVAGGHAMISYLDLLSMKGVMENIVFDK